MTRSFDLAKLGNELASFIQDESTAFNAQDFFAVHIFFLDHIKIFAKFLFSIREQFKLEIKFTSEGLMGFYAVPGNSKNFGMGFFKFPIQLIELLALQSTTGGIVLGVKIQNHFFAAHTPEQFAQTIWCCFRGAARAQWVEEWLPLGELGRCFQ